MNFISIHLPQSFEDIVKKVRSIVPEDIPVYLVGGAVRDILANREPPDLDFVVPFGALDLARMVADNIGAAYYPLDRGRETGRVVWIDPQGKKRHLDFAVFRDSDLEGDLQARDLTINAIAIDLNQPTALIDPLRGAADVYSKKIRACTADSFQADPVRVLRAIRFATDFNFRILPDTLQSMRAALPSLDSVSPERLRDELFHMLEIQQPATCMRVLDRTGGMPFVMPELESLRGLKQSPPHYADVWNHTMDVISKLERILGVLSEDFDPESAADLYTGMVSLRLGRYRRQIQAELNKELSKGRSVRSLLFFAALYHDSGKPDTQQVDPSGRIRFYDHDKVGSDIISARSRALRLSLDEISWLSLVIRNHLRPLLLAQSDHAVSRRSIYRFFRDTDISGVAICILSLADVWGTYGLELPLEIWQKQLDVVRSLFEAWWDKPEETVSPPILINGHVLMAELSLEPGPMVGKLLGEIREAGAVGLVQDQEQALALARSILDGEVAQKDVE